MKLIPVFGALLLAAGPCLAQSAPEWAPNGPGGVPPPPLNNVSADNQQAGQLLFTFPRDTCPGGTEQALRHQIETLAAGQPDYEAMAPKVAAEWRTQIDKVGPVTRQWGPLQSLQLQSRKWWGAVYDARFERASLRWEIACQDGKKITGISFKTVS